MSRWSMCCLLLLGSVASADDQHRLSFLEQEVRNLQRQVTTLSRRVDELSRPGQGAGSRPNPVVIGPEAKTGGELPSWVDAERWRKVRVGMGELELMELLGKPSNVREADGARVLLYALELGPSVFLGGSVTMRDRAVTEIRVPTLQ